MNALRKKMKSKDVKKTVKVLFLPDQNEGKERPLCTLIYFWKSTAVHVGTHHTIFLSQLCYRSKQNVTVFKELGSDSLGSFLVPCSCTAAVGNSFI